MTKKLNHFGWIALKGVAMGAADVVPGVSGGTIAFITGIYEELITSIKNLPKAAPLLFKKGAGIKTFWQHGNINFLLSLVLGILISVVSLARLMTWLLANQSILTWSFFFGLILASTLYVMKEVDRKKIGNGVAFVLGALVAYWITAVSPSETPQTYWFIFLSGAIAICAMILPGISGSFILLLLGKYLYMMEAIKVLKIDVIVVFLAGAAIGITLFSNVLSWMLKRYHQLTIAVLGGFMIGSLNKVWPWKQKLTFYIDSHGNEKVLTEANVLPAKFEALTGLDSQVVMAVIAALAGFSIVYVIEFLAGKMQSKRD